ncbi:MAG: thiamine phosphate synthase [Parvibaculum sp.]|nr:thiamine phosphate synthase [Parvibaculum sp.]
MTRMRDRAEILRTARRLTGRADAVSLIGVTDAERMPEPEKALAALPRGSALIWRAYGATPDATRLRRISADAQSKGCVVLIAGAACLARRLGTQGLHLPERMLTRRYENRYLLSLHGLPPGLTVTAACHSEKAVHAAARAGADAVLISPVFPTTSHPGAATLGLLGFTQLAKLARALGLAPYALGGITSDTQIRRLLGSGAAGVAGVSLLSP